MQKLTAFIMLTHFAIKAFAQFDFQGDSTSQTSFFDTFFYKRIDSVYQLEKDYDFEFRLLVHPAVSPDVSLFVLSFKNKTWTTRYFSFVRSTSSLVPLEKKLNEKKPEQLWKVLRKNHLLTLPDQEMLKDSSGNEAFAPVLDGISYSFELQTKDKYRTYVYHCPKVAEKYYPYIEELKWAVAILRAVFEYCGVLADGLC